MQGGMPTPRLVCRPVQGYRALGRLVDADDDALVGPGTSPPAGQLLVVVNLVRDRES